MDFVEFENMMDMSQSVTSSKSTRWERKAEAATKTSSVGDNSSSDRFIPNRSGMQVSSVSSFRIILLR